MRLGNSIDRDNGCLGRGRLQLTLHVIENEQGHGPLRRRLRGLVAEQAGPGGPGVHGAAARGQSDPSPDRVGNLIGSVGEAGVDILLAEREGDVRRPSHQDGLHGRTRVHRCHGLPAVILGARGHPGDGIAGCILHQNAQGVGRRSRIVGGGDGDDPAADGRLAHGVLVRS